MERQFTGILFVSCYIRARIRFGQWKTGIGNTVFFIIYFKISNRQREVCEATRELALIFVSFVMVNFFPSFGTDLAFPELPVLKHHIDTDFSSTIRTQTAEMSNLLSAFESLFVEFQ